MSEPTEPIQSIQGCGPSRGKCVCKCTPEKRDCGHVWDGETQRIEYESGGCSESVTCSICGMSALTHDMWCGTKHPLLLCTVCSALNVTWWNGESGK